MTGAFKLKIPIDNAQLFCYNLNCQRAINTQIKMKEQTFKYIVNITYETPSGIRHCIKRTFYVPKSKHQESEIENVKKDYRNLFSKIVKINVKRMGDAI